MATLGEFLTDAGIQVDGVVPGYILTAHDLFVHDLTSIEAYVSAITTLNTEQQALYKVAMNAYQRALGRSMKPVVTEQLETIESDGIKEEKEAILFGIALARMMSQRQLEQSI